MRVTDFIKQKGAIAIWNECNKNHKLMKKYILTECNLPLDKDISANMRHLYRDIRNSRNNSPELNTHKRLVIKITKELRGENNEI